MMQIFFMIFFMGLISTLFSSTDLIILCCPILIFFKSAGLMLFIDSPSAGTARAFTYLRTWFEDNNILLEDFFYFSKIGQQRIIKSVLLNRVLIGPIKKIVKKICIIIGPNDLLRQHMIYHDKYQIKLLVIDILQL